MKNINQLREASDTLSEMADAPDTKKLASLVRLGLFDSSKLTLLKRALAKDNTKMTRAEKDVLIDLLDRLLSVVTNDSATYNRVKHDVMTEDAKIKSPWNKTDGKTDVDITKIPPIVIMKRRAIRVFPDGQKVALYWADRLDKYISVPFQSIGLSEAKVPISDDDLKMNPALAARVAAAEAKQKTAEPIPAATPTALPKPEPKKVGYWDKTKKDHAALKSLKLTPAQRLAAHAGLQLRRGIIAGAKKVGQMMTPKPVALKERFLSRVARPLTEEGDESPFAYKRQRPESLIKSHLTGTRPERDREEEDIFNRSKATRTQRDVTANRANQVFANGQNPNRLPKAKREVTESIITGLKEFVTSAEDVQNIIIKESSVAVSKPMAKKLVALHESMNKVNQMKMEKMLNEDSDSFYKLVNFALKTL